MQHRELAILEMKHRELAILDKAALVVKQATVNRL